MNKEKLAFGKILSQWGVLIAIVIAFVFFSPVLDFLTISTIAKMKPASAVKTANIPMIGIKAITHEIIANTNAAVPIKKPPSYIF